MIDHEMYFFTFFANTKGRWIGKTLIDVLTTEFVYNSREYYEQAILLGVVRVDDMIVDMRFILKSSNKITHLVHMHELYCPRIDIIAEGQGLVVIYKPNGIPCHPTSRFQKFCVLNALAPRNLRCLHRLDAVTSGVLLLAEQECKITLEGSQKVYLAKVEGKFPAHLVVNKPIIVSLGMSTVGEGGKESETEFKLLAYKDGFSLIECHLKTGRSHQIRVHLKSENFVICGDILYSSSSVPRKYESCCQQLDDCSLVEKFVLSYCRGLDITFYEDKGICLHSYKYFVNGKWYIADMPKWASEFF